ncbi:MAG TPA: PAS domain-containing protein [Candidatus Acidoferrum sp.]|nr:PAS domain-containing protein [Candidatus Acidoferrum sp.]
MAFNWKEFLARGPERIGTEGLRVREWPFEELGITAAYILIAGLWCVFSDDVCDWLFGAPLNSPALQMLKGINFVTTTGLVLYLILRRSARNRRLAEEASRLSQERFESVALATTEAIWDWNLEANSIWWSEGIQKLFGYPPEDVSTKVEWWLERLHPEDKERVMRTIRQAIDTGTRTWAGYYRFRRKDDTYASVLDHGFILQNAEGKPSRLVGGIRDITERRKAEEALKMSRRQLRALSARLQSAREEERASVAREIHDELGQMLTALKINLDWLERKIGEREQDRSLNPLLDRIVECEEMADAAIVTVQRIATELRPGMLDHLGLAAALQQEAAGFQKRSGITCEVQLPADAPKLPREVATAIFRIFQEALTNVARHAKATTVRARLEATAERVTLSMEDDGRGIRPEDVSGSRSLGLLGMRERATVLGGDVAIEPVTPRGCRVTVRLPRKPGAPNLWAEP